MGDTIRIEFEWIDLEIPAMTPGQLVKAVAIALDMPEETVTQHDRNLVVAGLRTKGGRGRSAPQVTPLDAARLLVATLGSMRTKDSAETVELFKGAVRFRSRFDKKAIPVIDGQPEGHTFIEALASLINLASGSPPASERERLIKQMASTNISVDVPYAAGSITVIAGNNQVQSYIYGERPQSDPRTSNVEENAELSKFGPFLRRTGIRQTRLMFGNVILLLGIAFQENGLKYASVDTAINAIVTKVLKSKKSKADR